MLERQEIDARGDCPVVMRGDRHKVLAATNAPAGSLESGSEIWINPDGNTSKWFDPKPGAELPVLERELAARDEPVDVKVCAPTLMDRN